MSAEHHLVSKSTNPTAGCESARDTNKLLKRSTLIITRVGRDPFSFQSG